MSKEESEVVELSLRVCRKCGLPKPAADFVKGHARCRSCWSAQNRSYYAANRAKLTAASAVNRRAKPEQYAAMKRRYYEGHWLEILVKQAKWRSARAGIPFAIAVSDVRIPEFCPILGIRIEMGRGKNRVASPTIDRIVPSLGYVPGNIAVISFRANRIKNDGTAEEHEAVARFMRAQGAK